MSTISKITQSLTTAEDMRNQTKLIMQPYANWEQYLTPAPLSIAILGELVFISSSTDFSINKNPPKDGYKFIKHPDSFRACLMQVCNSGWWAFNEAHNNMDQIRLHTAQVPNYMKEAVHYLLQDNDELVKAHLPLQLANIRRIADECLQLSVDTKQYFTDVINIIHELLEACVKAEGIYRDEMKEIKNKLEENELKKKSSEEANKRTEMAMKALEKQMAEARNDYQRALDSLPSGWDMVGMDFVNGLTKSMTTLVDGLVSNCISRLDRDSSANANSQSKSQSNFQESERDLFAEINAYSKSAEILNYVQNIQALMKVNCENDEIAWTNLLDEKSQRTKSGYIKESLNRLKDNLNKITDCPSKKQAQDICTKGIEICNQLAKYAPDGKCDKDKSSEIIKEVLNLNKSALYFDSSSKAITNSPAISPMPPMMQKEANRTGTMTPSQLATENARFAIEQTRAQLNKSSESYDKCLENIEKNQKELTEILVTLKKCKVEEMDFKKTIEMLVKGMDAMGKVKVQWEKMVLFFQMVSNMVKTNLSQNLIDFVSTSEATQKISYDAKLHSKDLLYNQAFRASNIASLVNMISGTYTEISNMYLMDRVSSLGRLMVMDKSKPEFEHERLQLQNSCEEAQKGILKLVLENKEEFNRKSNERMEKIERELLAILPPVSSEKKKMIEDTVNNGFSNEEEQYC